MCVSSQHNKAPGCCLKHKLIVRRGATESTPFTLRQGRKHTEKLLLSHFQVQRELQGHTSPSLRQCMEPSFPVSAISPETSSLGSFVSHDLSILPSKRDSRVLKFICGWKQKLHKPLVRPTDAPPRLAAER